MYLLLVVGVPTWDMQACCYRRNIYHSLGFRKFQATILILGVRYGPGEQVCGFMRGPESDKPSLREKGIVVV